MGPPPIVRDVSLGARQKREKMGKTGKNRARLCRLGRKQRPNAAGANLFVIHVP